MKKKITYVLVVTLFFDSVMMALIFFARCCTRENYYLPSITAQNVDHLVPVRVLNQLGESILSLAFVPNSETLVVVSSDRTVRLWDIDRRLSDTSAKYGGIASSAIGVHESSTIIACACGNTFPIIGDIHVKDAVNGRTVAEIPNQGMVGAIAISLDGEKIAVASGNTTTDFKVQIHELQNGKGFVRPINSNLVSQIQFSPIGHTVAINQVDSVTIANSQQGTMLATLRQSFPNNQSGSFLKVGSVTFNSDGTKLATMSTEGFIEIWNISNFTQPTFIGYDSIPPDLTQSSYSPLSQGILFSINGDLIVAAGGDTVRFWSLATNEQVKYFQQKSPLLALSSDGSLLAIANADGRITVWGIEQ